MGEQELDLVTGVDPHSGCLAVIPRSWAEADVEFIAVITGSTTLGQLRKHDSAWLEVESFVRDEEETGGVAAKDLPDDAPYDFGDWFGDDFALNTIPEARLRTAELCPVQVLDAYGHSDDGFGMDYVPARWFSPDDRGAIEAELRSLGFRVIPDDALISKYLDF